MLIPVLAMMTMTVTIVVRGITLFFYLEDTPDVLFYHFSLIPFRIVFVLPKGMFLCFTFNLKLLFMLSIF
jgi:hypothetical protein